LTIRPLVPHCSAEYPLVGLERTRKQSDVTQSSSQFAGGVREGEILAGKYRIEKILGVGGMGIVVAAHHIQLDEHVAIKFLLPEALSNAEAVGRFAREARAAVKIKSEHVARVIDVGTLENGSPYMVMEFLEGVDLGVMVQQQGALAIEQAVEFVLQACEAIAEAHGLGIVHRDLKPANLFCIRRADGLLSVKVLDFGISKVTGMGGSAPDVRMTSTSAVFGSPLYMSPEQMLSARDVDARTDIWALGAILFELLTAKSPFDGTTLPEVFGKISTQPPPPIRTFRPDVPEGVEQVILRCLAKDRTGRYLNVAELAIALAPFAPKRARASVERISRVIQNAGLSASALALPPSSDTNTQTVQVQTDASWGQTKPPSSGRTKWLVGATFGVVALAGIAATLWTRTGATPTPQPAASITLAAGGTSLPLVLPVATNAPSVAVAPMAEPVRSAKVEATAVVSSESKSKPVSGIKPAVGRTTPRPIGVTLPSPAPTAKATVSAPKANCDPPYTLDSEGRKHFKPECFKN
jgi:eukaryotic-like serine/threonine-protein kinase